MQSNSLSVSVSLSISRYHLVARQLDSSPLVKGVWGFVYKMRTVLHIDLNSYFATAEQLANPFLRGKAIAIGGSEGSRSVIVAASMEAKVFGIKVGMSHLEAVQRCPHLYFIDGDPIKYQYFTQKFYDICKQYSDRLDIYSIDEIFLELTHWVKNIDEAVSVAKRIKRQLAKEVGEYFNLFHWHCA